MTYLAVTTGVLVLLGIFILTFRAKRVSPQARKHIEGLIGHVETISDPAARVLEADKVLHEALKAAGGRGSVGDCLKKQGSTLPNKQAVWDAHKLRNRIAHEPKMSVSNKQSDHAVSALLKAARKVIGNR